MTVSAAGHPVTLNARISRHRHGAQSPARGTQPDSLCRVRRRCSRTGCAAASVATLTYIYADSVAVVGPLALRSEPGTYDLCASHSQGLSAPRGWEVIRLPLDADEPTHSADDLLALADAVREAAGLTRPDAQLPPSVVQVARRRHLTLLTDADPRS